MSHHRDRGMVTAELAVAIPVVVLVLAFCLGGISAGIDQIRCIDAARAAARSAARGDPVAESRQRALSAAPTGAVVQIDTGGTQVHVLVTARAGAVGGLLPGWQLRAEASGPVEEAP